MRKLRMEELGRLSPEAFRQTAKRPLVLVLENIRSMHNVGSIFRSADAFLVERIRLCGYTPRPPHRDIHKTALGATETVAWQYDEAAVTALTELRAAGYRILALEQTDQSTGLQSFRCAAGEKTAIVLGNEVDGVSDAALACCEGVIEIPQSGTKHSLNVAVAAGIVLWEWTKSCLNERPEPSNSNYVAD